MPLQPGDSFYSPSLRAFGVVMRVNEHRHVGLVLLQSGMWGECTLSALAEWRDRVKAFELSKIS